MKDVVCSTFTAPLPRNPHQFLAPASAGAVGGASRDGGRVISARPFWGIHSELLRAP